MALLTECLFFIGVRECSAFQEVIYQRAMAIEMEDAELKFSREHEMPIYYKRQQIGTRRVDFLVEDVVSLEIKAVTLLEDVHLAQAKNYLEAYDLEVGLLINFGAKSLQQKRLINKKFKQANQGNPEIKNRQADESNINGII
ncbi:GxxExxY protein [Microbacter margulisiae]|uniref:GxxExxY protein n=1 Tax=Microbacter margulisiae TaxID=1350067 RepID=A0A7W5H1H5_9PORP|nr:GxxExxY protein [Microbacter margulisiae]MBB3186634.1 GxxExxY protein [Microbacter margulisiae]